MAKNWKVQFTDKDDSKIQTSSHDSKLEALKWIKTMYDRDRVENTGFEVVNGPYDTNDMKYTPGQVKLWFDADHMEPEGYIWMKSVEHFVDDFVITIRHKLSAIQLIDLCTEDDFGGHSFDDIISYFSNNNATHVKVAVHGKDQAKKQKMVAHAKEDGFEVVDSVAEATQENVADVHEDNGDTLQEDEEKTVEDGYATKVWVDDIRPAPEGYAWIKSVDDFVKFIDDNGIKDVEVFDFDDDAGEYAKDGGDYIKCLSYLEFIGADGIKVRIHAEDPVSVKKMEDVIKKNQWDEVFDVIDEYDENVEETSEETIDETEQIEEKEDAAKKDKLISTMKKASQDFQKNASNYDPEQFSKIVVAFDDLIAGVGKYDFKQKRVLKEVEDAEPGGGCSQTEEA